MTKTKKKQQQTKINWFIIAIVIIFATLPGVILIKYLTDEINPYLVSVLRYLIVAIVTLPFVISAFIKHKKIMIQKAPIMIACSVLIAIGVPLFYAALSMSNVLFTEIINLFGPIIFAIISIVVTRDRISRNAIVGLLFAILGGMVIIFLPLWSGSGAVVQFGWLPLIFMAINVLTTSFAPVFYRKMDEEGVPLTASIGITFFFVLIVSAIMAVIDAGPEVFYEIQNVSLNNWVILVYLGAIITVLFRFIKTKAYEQIGTISQASINYLGVFLGIISPIIILGDTLTWEMLIGAILIIIGIMFTREQMQHYNKKQNQVRKTHRKRTNRKGSL